MRVENGGSSRELSGNGVVIGHHDVGAEVMTFDKLTYAGNLASLRSVQDHSKHHFVQADIRDRTAVASALAEFRPDRIYHLAAESHVDRSISSAAER